MKSSIHSMLVIALMALVMSITSLTVTQPAQSQGACDAAGAETISAVLSGLSGDTGFDRTGTDYDILLTALTAAGQNTAVAAPAAAFTLFAPNDAAAIALAQDLGFGGTDESGAYDTIVASFATIGDGDPIPTLTSVLQYHLLGSIQDGATVAAATSLATIEGGPITVSGMTLTDLAPELADATITQTDIAACNGVIHGVDRVMLPMAVSPAATPEPTPAATDTIKTAARAQGPAAISAAPEIAETGVYGFGLNVAAGDPTTTAPAAAGGIGGGDAGTGLAATGNSTEAAFAVAVGLFAVGGSFVVSGRRRQH